jgi:ATP/maltotriose-dependent transcriptional regulator MalT
MPVLATKLRPPRPRRRLVARTGLTDRLRVDGGEGPRLVLVAGPAGFGKTTLLTQWLAVADSSQRRVAWLALDPHDADLRLFLTHLVAAIPTVEPGWAPRARRGRVVIHSVGRHSTPADRRHPFEAEGAAGPGSHRRAVGRPA